MNARVEAFDQDETDYRALSAPPVLDPVTGISDLDRRKTLRTTQDGQNRHAEPFGDPEGLSQSRCYALYNWRGAKSLWHPAAVVYPSRAMDLPPLRLNLPGSA